MTTSCPCTNGGICELKVNYALEAPAPPTLFIVPDWPVAQYVMNLIGCVEAPWAFQTPDKNVVPVPVSCTRIIDLYYDGNVIGVLVTAADTAYLAFKGTTTQEEWRKNMQLSETPYVSTVSSILPAGLTHAQGLACGCGSGHTERVASHHGRSNTNHDPVAQDDVYREYTKIRSSL